MWQPQGAQVLHTASASSIACPLRPAPSDHELLHPSMLVLQNICELKRLYLTHDAQLLPSAARQNLAGISLYSRTLAFECPNEAPPSMIGRLRARRPACV